MSRAFNRGSFELGLSSVATRTDREKQVNPSGEEGGGAGAIESRSL
jgi:hypothetical protein